MTARGYRIEVATHARPWMSLWMDLSTLFDKACKNASLGLDTRTNRAHFECVLKRALTPAEDAAILAAFRAAEPARWARERLKAEKAARDMREAARRR